MLRQLSHLLLIVCWMPLAWAQNPVPVAARVALAVGTVQVVTQNAPPKSLVANQTVSESDRIITGDDAMVILVFVDQGRVALRANSELLIKRYTIDPAGTKTAMHLELVYGAMRQISGDGAHRQPERYRLNTPVAAIGVRGTDFLAKTSGQTMETYIQDGVIVLLPLQNNANSVMLPMATLSSGDAGRYAMVMSSGAIERKSISPEDIDRIFGIRMQTSAVAESAATNPNPRSNAAQSSARRAELTDNSLRLVDGRLPSELTKADLVVPAPTPTQPEVVTQQPAPVTATNTQLIWGKFSDPLALPFKLPVPFNVAQQGRHVTVGQLGQYALWSLGPNGPMDKGLKGQADFSLGASEAFYQSATGASVPMTLTDPRLSVDFDRMQFVTQLSLVGSGVPSQQLAVGGKINDEGIFLGKAANQSVAGALSQNGKEAGYLFNIKAGTDTIQGITLWTTAR